MTTFIYPLALVVISIFVAGLEYFFPKREQPQLREDLWSDFVHLVFNGHFLGVILFGLATNFVLPYSDALLSEYGLIDSVYRNAAQPWPMWLQIVVAIVVIDFIQWCVHNLLHRVPFFWEFHKTHHSVKDKEMDWIVSFRFQWTEVIVYKSILYLPLAWFGFDPTAVLVHAIFGTLIGHLNHANIDWDWGPLKYVLNSPNMHIWHHDYEGDIDTTVNFGIIFSTWDWIFGTAKMPPKDPEHIGFPGVEEFPHDFFTQAIWPFQKWFPSLNKHRVVAGVMGGVLVAAGYAAATVPSNSKVATPMFGEAAAASQPSKNTAPASAYATSPAEAEEALAKFGTAAASDGMAHPEYMVSVNELAAALGAKRLVLLDVRPTERFEEGHIPTARQLYRPDYSGGEVPGLSKSKADLEAMLQRLGVNKDSVVVAYTDGGPEAYRLWWTLRDIAGYDIRVLDGGLQRWKFNGHGIAAGAGLTPDPGTIELPKQVREPRRWADIETFKQGKEVVLLDTRSAEEHAGKKHNKKAKRPGRIPGAKHLDWYSVFRSQEDDYRLSPAAKLESVWSGLGVEKGTPVVTYCQSGTRSATIYFAMLQAGYAESDFVNYDGSWAEYSRLDLPAEP